MVLFKYLTWTTRLTSTDMEEQRFSYYYKDRLTNLFMMEYLELAIRYHIKVSEVYTYDIKLHNFSQFNKEFGWKKGDEFLVHFARFINNLYENSVVFRVEGDGFMILSEIPNESIERDVTDYINNEKTMITCSIIENKIKVKT